MVSLSELLVNEKGTIHSFTIGRPETNRLASLGFTPGAQVDMTQNYGRGPLIVMVRGHACSPWTWRSIENLR